MAGRGRPTLTAVRRVRPGRVALELDGAAWRVVPDAVVVRCGLAPGTELDRPLLRELRRAIREAEALDAALRTVARRDLPAARLRGRLAARGVRAPAAERAVAALASAGIVDDARLAAVRARTLAERGWGDAAVRARLEGEGLAPELVAAAVAELPPEAERAARAAGGRDRRAAWGFLLRRGFAPEAVEDALGGLDADA